MNKFKVVFILIKIENKSKDQDIISCYLNEDKANRHKSELNFLLNEKSIEDYFYTIKRIPIEDVPNGTSLSV